ncbi:MAG: LON peptidase substrate-binding domain-containing protein [Anaerolineae bacterium]|nr:LON peptidase substrate-binding domain-containing protein [Anaerolineae bacterium]
MFDLPLFPLQLVLFPLQSLALHIFEERYKEMINHCIATDSPFGIVLLEQGAAEEGRSRVEAKLTVVGTTAAITQVQHLPEGRMNIIVVGRERFRVSEFKYGQPYLVGSVEAAPMLHPGQYVRQESIDGLQQGITRYLKVLEGAGRIQPGARRLPNDPLTLSSLAAGILHDINVTQRQALLEADNLQVMIDDLRSLYRREIVLLEAMLAEPQDDHLGPFSPN